MTAQADQEALFNAFMDAVKASKASGQDIEVALITLVSVRVGILPTESQQDAYLNWFVSGVENLLKASGVRTTARPNPLAARNERPS